MRKAEHEDAADEIAAYDVVSLLIDREGARPVLAVLRCWYLLTVTDGRAAAGARAEGLPKILQNTAETS